MLKPPRRTLCFALTMLALACDTDQPSTHGDRDQAGPDSGDVNGPVDTGPDIPSPNDLVEDSPEDPGDALPPEDTLDAGDEADQTADAADALADPDRGDSDWGGDGCPGSPICATPFEGLEVLWAEPLYLCSAWEPGPTFERVQQRAVQLILPPQSIDGLFAPSLSATFAGRVVAARGAYGGQRHYIEEGSAIGSVLDYQVETVGQTSRLRAEIRHTLGEAGTLLQRIDLQRSAGSTNPLDYGALEEIEMRFEPPEGEEIELVLCSRLVMSEASVEVLAARSDLGEHLTVLRMWGDGSESSWHDPAVVPLFAPFRAATDIGIGYTLESAGYWTGLRAVAQDGSWEESLIDPGADLLLASWGGATGFYLRFSRQAGEDHPTVTAVTSEGSLEYEAYSDWVVVDNEHLFSRYQSLCDDLVVMSGSSWLGYSFQIVGCPDDTPLGYDQVTVVPVEYPADPTQVGTEWTGEEAIQIEEQPALRFTFASGTFTLIRQSPTSITTWKYLAATTEGSTISSGYLWDVDHIADAYEQDRHGAVLVERRFENDDASIRLHQVLFNAGMGTAGTRPLHAVSQELVWPGGVRFVDAVDRMHYTTTHHNMADSFQAESDDIRFTWTSSGAGMGNTGSFWVEAVLLSDDSEVIPLTSVYPVE
ncbi:MAG: hypothetical protein JW797_20355 [Bradymonadales bacterium]|nr:hypothetical protein [Bradymonadales bacterium]